MTRVKFANDIYKTQTDPLERLRNLMVFGARDMGAAEMEAMCYGIVVGWGDRESGISDELYQEFHDKFGWSREFIDALEALKVVSPSDPRHPPNETRRIGRYE